MVTNKPMLYLGIGLALLASDLCLLLLILNCLSWINILHMDLTFIEQAADTIFAKQWQLYFQTATMAWLVLVLIQQTSSSSDRGDEKKKKEKKVSHGAVVKSVSIVVLTLLMPHILKAHRHHHPIIRRSLIGQSAAVVNNKQQNDGWCLY